MYDIEFKLLARIGEYEEMTITRGLYMIFFKKKEEKESTRKK